MRELATTLCVGCQKCNCTQSIKERKVEINITELGRRVSEVGRVGFSVKNGWFAGGRM